MSVIIKLDTAQLDKIAAGLDISTRAVIGDLALQVEAKAKEICPVDTGAMRASIFTELMKTGPVVARIGPSVEYAPWVELGHHARNGRFVAAQPFLRPAVESVVKDLNSGALWARLFT